MKRIALLLFVCRIAILSNGQLSTDSLNRLSEKQKSIVAIAVFTANGDLSQLKTEMINSLEGDMTVNQIKEVIVHAYAYCGFPRSIRGLQTLMALLEERKSRGVNDTWGPEATPIQDTRSKFERGKEVLEKLTGASQDGPRSGYAAFSPEIEIFLKEHLFADIFERDVLTYAERELVTISVLGSIGKVEPMLRTHLTICLHVGIGASQLAHFTDILKVKLGKKVARSARSVLKEVIESKR